MDLPLRSTGGVASQRTRDDRCQPRDDQRRPASLRSGLTPAAAFCPTVQDPRRCRPAVRRPYPRACSPSHRPSLIDGTVWRATYSRTVRQTLQSTTSMSDCSPGERRHSCRDVVKTYRARRALDCEERGDGKRLEFQMSRAGIEPATRCLKGAFVGCVSPSNSIPDAERRAILPVLRASDGVRWEVRTDTPAYTPSSSAGTRLWPGAGRCREPAFPRWPRRAVTSAGESARKGKGFVAIEGAADGRGDG